MHTEQLKTIMGMLPFLIPLFLIEVGADGNRPG